MTDQSLTDHTRIKGGTPAIDYRSIHAFFDQRGRGSYRCALSATMYQDDEPELVEQRDRTEKQRVAADLDLPGVHRALDIGCGIGRWGWFLAEQQPGIDYDGIDFAAPLIERAHREAATRGLVRLRFQTMSATAIDPSVLQPPYDLILISGLLIYLNDADCRKVIAAAGQLCADGGRIYVREPVGVGERFTLDHFYSNELAHEYSAIYRSREELDRLLQQTLRCLGFQRRHGAFLFPENLEKRAETRQYYTVLRKD